MNLPPDFEDLPVVCVHQIFWEYDGVRLSIDRWSLRTGIPYPTLYKRREVLGLSMAQTLSFEPIQKRVPVPVRVIVTSDGQRGTYHDWSARTGLPVNTIKKRYVTMKWTADETVGLVPRGRATVSAPRGDTARV
jgi:hypothetical protein